ncbi:hypothetical protein MNBD_GAMMA16-1922 [hydrothermal vent metagenome]|uniref:Plasmid pRiA4b Orf3-like domain-containing protein n=1 Tax=hydrothermal vent metagenome TaxID=652676 RepID=A0A3B0ZSF0_9ZZZZ
MSAKQLRSRYQIKIILEGSKPPIWRRLLVHSSIKLNLFHEAIQYSMGWLNCHLHQFEKDGILYGLADDELGADFGPELEDENEYRLSDLLNSEKDSLIYEYDFGDGWRHKVTLEKILPFDTSAGVVTCIKGKRSCPPENCGGIWGYENLLEIISDPAHSEHEEIIEWLGSDFEPEYFSLSETNNMLSQYVK